MNSEKVDWQIYRPPRTVWSWDRRRPERRNCSRRLVAERSVSPTSLIANLEFHSAAPFLVACTSCLPTTVFTCIYGVCATRRQPALAKLANRLLSFRDPISVNSHLLRTSSAACIAVTAVSHTSLF